MTIAGVPLRVTQAFLALILAVGFYAGQDVAGTRLEPEMHIGNLQDALHAFDSGSPLYAEIPPSFGWALAAGLGVAAIYVLSIVAHELGHLVAARRAGVDVAAMELNATGGFVEMADDDALTAGGLATIAGAGPLVTACLALISGTALAVLGWPLTGMRVDHGSAPVGVGRILSAAFELNLFCLVVNLVPIRPLDGADLLTALRMWRARRGG
jgi:Zn-dependent protease